MSHRIRQLEDALKILNTYHSSEPHPLLSDNLLAVKTGVDLLVEEENVANDDTAEFYLDPNDLASSIGTLAISDKGDTRFVGRSGAEVRYEAVIIIADRYSCSYTKGFATGEANDKVSTVSDSKDPSRLFSDGPSL